MRRKTLFDSPRAEREADRAGLHFMDSPDVVGDMSRAYGRNLSCVQLHTDQAAADHVAGSGADAIAEGRHIYFGQGAYRPHDPAGRGLLAHELAHTLQQSGGGGGLQETAPMGAPQGGRLMDWMRRKFSRKRELPAPAPAPASMSARLGLQAPVPLGPVHRQPMYVRQHVKSRIDPNSIQSRDYFSSGSYALNQMLQNASRKDLQDPLLQKLVIDDFNQNMNLRLKAHNGQDKNMMEPEFRGGAGELDSLNMILEAVLPEDLGEKAILAGGVGGPLLENPLASMEYITQQLKDNQAFSEIMGSIAPAFQGVDYYDRQTEKAVEDENGANKFLGLHGGADQISNIMMNNLVLRLVNKPLTARSVQEAGRRAQLTRDNPELDRPALSAKLREAGLLDPSTTAYLSQLQSQIAGVTQFIDNSGQRTRRQDLDENGVAPGLSFRTFLSHLFRKKAPA